MCLGNAISVDAMNHAWERKLVSCSAETLFALQLETKGVPQIYTRV